MSLLAVCALLRGKTLSLAIWLLTKSQLEKLVDATTKVGALKAVCAILAPGDR